MAIFNEWVTDSSGTKMFPDKQVLLEAWCRDGATDKEIAARIGIAESTLGKWKRQYPIIKQVLKINKEVADSIVERAMYKNACEGDYASARFWLMNRQPEKWRDGRKLSPKEEELLQAQVEEAQARAKIAKNQADKLTADHHENELLEALVNPKVVTTDDSSIQSETSG